MFKPQFSALVESGEKRQTVRPVPKRMPKPGDTISLRAWTGAPYRSKQRVLSEAVISGVHRVTITQDGVVCHGISGAEYAPGNDGFAKADGFESWDQMREWFLEQHGLPFNGIAIYWRNLP